MRGGFINPVVRVGTTVRRTVTENAEFVHQLLRHFEQQGWDGAPRFLGVDEQGREVLTYLDGYVSYQASEDSVTSTESLIRVAQLVRRFHDLTAETPLAGDQEVVCHNDLSPKNTVYRTSSAGLRPVAFVDWDLAAPGARVHDVAHMCWQYLDLGAAVRDVATTAERLLLICDAYDLHDRTTVIDTILWWQNRCWQGIEARAAAGDAAMTTLRDAGVVRAVRAAHDWVLAHQHELASALTAP